MKSDRETETGEGTVPRSHRTFNYFISYVFYVSRERTSERARAQGSRDVNGRRKVENEERKGDRTERGSE